MAIVSIELLKSKFESGDFPRSTDYQDLIDTLGSASGALSNTDGLSEGTTNKYFTDERAQDALGNSLGTGLSYNDTTGAISVTSNTYDSYGSASTVAGNLSTHESDTTTHGTTGNIVGTSDTQTLTNKTLTSPKINEDVILTATATELNYVDGVTSAIQTQINSKAPLADPTFTGTVSGVTKTHVGLGNVDNTTDAGKPVSTATQTALDLKANLADPTFTGTVSGITKTHVGLGNVDNTSDASKPVSTAQQTALDLKANLATPTFTGTVTASNDLVVDGNLTVNGTTFNASSTSITIEDNMVQLAHQNAANTVDLGLVVAYNDGSAKHAGIVRDVSDNKWKLFKGVTSEPATTVDFTQGSLDDLAVAGLTASSLTVGDVSNTEFGYLDGVTSAIQTQLNDKAPLASPTFTGTVSLPSGTVTSAMISDGTIVNADINASAAIDWTKLGISSTVSATEIGYVDGVTSGIQAQLNDKAPLASPTFTGTPTLPTGTIATTQTAGNSTTAIATTAFVTTADNLKANLAGPTFTGNVTLPSTTSIGNVSATEIGYVDGVTSAIQTQINTKTSTGRAIAMAIVFGG